MVVLISLVNTNHYPFTRHHARSCAGIGSNGGRRTADNNLQKETTMRRLKIPEIERYEREQEIKSRNRQRKLMEAYERDYRTHPPVVNGVVQRVEF